MTIKTLSRYFKKLEATTSRNEMIEILAQLFHQAESGEIGELVFLIQGRVGPLFSPLEFGMADKMVIRAIAQAFAVKEKAVRRLFHQKGDLGRAAEELAARKELRIKDKELRVRDVYQALREIAEAEGKGSQETKLKKLATLFLSLDPLSVRYVVRIPLAKLRLGFSDMTVLDGLSWMIDGTKNHRGEIERAYNVRPDLAYVAKIVKTKGIKALSSVTPQLGTPIRMAQAERLSSAKEILDKIGACAVEPKIDGFRLQVHYAKVKSQPCLSVGRKLKVKSDIKLFSRNLEEVTFMYPDIVEGVKKQIKAEDAIFEGEAVAYNQQTGEYLPFQETVQRKRKYRIAQMAAEVPLKLICFDLLYLNCQNYIHQPYQKRRAQLERIVGKGETLLVADEQVVRKTKRLEQIFEDAVSRGLEGVMAKRLNGIYQAGARNWNWIKYKRSYSGRLTDTIDAVVMGYDYGQGKRSGFGIGDFLIGVYDKRSDTFKTIAKIGTGLTDDEWREMKKRCDAITVGKKPARYDVDKSMVCNVWVQPKIVVVIRADEISRSPVHTAGRLLGPSKSGTAQIVKTPGFALRFPRLEQFRTDKLPEDATAVSEIANMYKQQVRKS